MARNARPRDPSANDIVVQTELDQAVLKFGQELVRVRSGETTREITRNEAVFGKVFETATKGSPHAQRHYLDRMHAATQQHLKQIDSEIKYWGAYIRRKRKLLETARQRGDPEPEILPHPDDIVLDPHRGVRFLGPLDQAGLDRVRNQALQRDALFYQDALEHRLDKCRGPMEVRRGDAFFLANLFNMGLPERFRLSDDASVHRRMLYDRMPMRDLLKKTRAAWVACGQHDVTRGARFLPPDKMMAILHILRECKNEWREAGSDPSQVGPIATRTLARICGDFGIAQA